MTKTIAVAGKGGTGKTTIAALLVKFLSQKGLVLAVDADPSSNLSQALGLSLDESRTVGRIREKMAEDVSKDRLSPDIGKPEYLYSKVVESLIESKGFDLLTMGRPEGPGCYCASNEFLRACLDKLVKDYKYEYVVMDCEAGMEHISRQTTRDVDVLLIMSDPTMKGVTTAARMKKLIGEMRSSVGRVGLVINRVREELSPEIKRVIGESGLQIIATIPEDPDMAGLEMKGRPVTELREGSPLQTKAKEITEGLRL
ncbi:MAG: AAA family ATPase [Dehalococcoidia bacterium]|nr:AAA family ATPase [Dehalococcoidia bacterium]MDH4367341.1 AAA family ATPase [Dehalococcoidia bacterium]